MESIERRRVAPAMSAGVHRNYVALFPHPPELLQLLNSLNDAMTHHLESSVHGLLVW
jgi:hypothetical protein